MTKLYGIKNCDTVKKAQKWLATNNHQYEFIDFRQDGLSKDKVESWLQQVDWTLVLNKRSTSYRQLDDATKESLSAETVADVLLDNPTLIKRPVLEYNGQVHIGFKDTEYQKAFS